MFKLFSWKTPVQRAVRRGARLLDKIAPDWYEVVNCDTIDMSDPRYCVAGQVSGPFGGYHRLVELHRIDPFHYGFDGTWDEYDELHRAWREEIYARRMSSVGSKPSTVHSY